MSLIKLAAKPYLCFLPWGSEYWAIDIQMASNLTKADRGTLNTGLQLRWGSEYQVTGGLIVLTQTKIHSVDLNIKTQCMTVTQMVFSNITINVTDIYTHSMKKK